LATGEQALIQIVPSDLGRGFRLAGGFDGFLAKPGLAVACHGRLRWRCPSLAKPVLAFEYYHLGQRRD
jgi:hypothetical protein